MLFISPYYVTRTPTNGSAVKWSRVSYVSRDQYTAHSSISLDNIKTAFK